MSKGIRFRWKERRSDLVEIRQATKNDIDSIEKIYESIHDEEEKGLTTIGWIRNIYPTRKTAEDALDRKDLFVLEDENKIVAAVLHCLAVSPYQKSKGYGRTFISFYENYAEQHNCITLRMDTNVRNTRARNLYQQLGYEEIGVVKCVFNGIPDVQLVCLEKYPD